MGRLRQALGLEKANDLGVSIPDPTELPPVGGYVDLPVMGPTGITTAWSNGVPVLDPGTSLEQLIGAGGISVSSASAIYRTQPNVRKVIEFIATNMASVPFHLYERVSDTVRRRVSDHPIAALLREPAIGSTSYRWLVQIISDWCLYDRWVARPIVELDPVTRDGRPSLVRIPARRVTFLGDDLDRVVQIAVSRQVTDTTDPVKTYDANLLAWDTGYTPDGVGGITPMITLRQLLAEAAEAVEWRRQVWANGGRITGWIERPTDAPTEGWGARARRRAEQEFNSRYTGTGPDAGGVPILDDGMKFHGEKAYTASDMQDYEIRQLSAVEVSSAFHIAPELVGARQGTYSNVKEYRQALYRDNLGNRFAALEQVLNLVLLRGEPSLYIEANIDAKLRGTFEDRITAYVRASGRPYLTTDEVRAMENREPVPGGDELVTPANVIVGGQVTPNDPSGTGADNADAGTGDQPKGIPDDQVERFAAELAAAVAGQAARIEQVRKSGGRMTDERASRETADAAAAVLLRAAEVAAAVIEVETGDTAVSPEAYVTEISSLAWQTGFSSPRELVEEAAAVVSRIAAEHKEIA